MTSENEEPKPTPITDLVHMSATNAMEFILIDFATYVTKESEKLIDLNEDKKINAVNKVLHVYEFMENSVYHRYLEYLASRGLEGNKFIHNIFSVYRQSWSSLINKD